MVEQELLFSLDIGTRTVVGIVGSHDGEKFNILAHEVEEHKERAMYDGQVHDIELVAKAATRVKEKLEAKLNIKLKRVAVAAAGRSLKTCKIFVERDIEPAIDIDSELVSNLEIEGIQLAQKEIEQQHTDEDLSYFCVGYTIVNYFLNNSIIGNPLGHKGKKLGMEVLATFLPRVVVDSLYSVVAKVGLEVSNLTLEPIAAMNVSIHSNLRLLNIALVDIGAGTSDIALTKEGTVFAFAMAPIAGDEITEKIAQTYLLDFDTAEKVKISLSSCTDVCYKDIMGLEYCVPSVDILKTIDDSIRILAKEISSKIVEFNGKSPSAVFLIGGGSQIPGLSTIIAEYLQIPAERVGIRKTDIIRNIELNGAKLTGPEFVTPIGIAITAHQNRQKDFLMITINEKNVKLFNSKTLSVADGLILIGYNPRNLIGRRGNAVAFKVNGRDEVVKGEPGEPAQIMLNGKKVGLDSPLTNGDTLDIQSAIDGTSCQVFVRDYIVDNYDKKIYFDGKEKILKPIIKINNVIAAMDAEIKNGDDVVIKAVDNILEFAAMCELNINEFSFLINGKKTKFDDIIKNGDFITFEANIKDSEVEKNQGFYHEYHEIKKNNIKSIDVLINGKPTKISAPKEMFIFADALNFLDIDLKNLKGIVEINLNDNKANFADEIVNGDKIEVKW